MHFPLCDWSFDFDINLCRATLKPHNGGLFSSNYHLKLLKSEASDCNVVMETSNQKEGNSR